LQSLLALAPIWVAPQLTALSSVPPTLVVTLGKVVFIVHVMALNLIWQGICITNTSIANEPKKYQKLKFLGV
jgi:hypothetical protein